MLRGKPMFDFLDEDREYAKVFNDPMTSVSDMEIPTVLPAYDFTNVGTIVDVGGGHGRLLATMLQKWPSSRRIFFDAESVVAGRTRGPRRRGRSRSLHRCRGLVL
jgi:hypothetical protein